MYTSLLRDMTVHFTMKFNWIFLIENITEKGEAKSWVRGKPGGLLKLLHTFFKDLNVSLALQNNSEYKAEHALVS